MLERYLDGEADASQEQVVRAHVSACSVCAIALADAVRLKRAVRLNAKRFEPSAEFRARIARQLATQQQKKTKIKMWWIPIAAGFAAMLLLTVLVVRFSSGARESELAEAMDLHVTALASSSPVEVVSTDRHTVKPWFQGKLPFAFNLPELAGTPYALLGGRVAYLHHAPCAQLIYGLQQHKISVFVCQGASGRSEVARAPLRGREWSTGQLAFSAVTDTEPQELETLERLWRSANP
jgi:anti-sigma factor RsiW